MTKPMIKAKITFWMINRDEHTFEVVGSGQLEWLSHGKKQLNTKLAGMSNTNNPIPINEKGWNIIERWYIEPEGDRPPVDKEDGIIIRSPLQKVRMDLIPEMPLVQIAHVFTFGSYHYGDRNWENGFSYSRCIGAAKRHFAKWCMGEDLDGESGLSHLAHACVNLIFLMEYQARGTGNDDRIKHDPEIIKHAFEPINCEKEKDE